MKGTDIRSKRKMLNLTQKELAIKLGVSHNTISNWEKGEVIPQSKNELIENFLNHNIVNVAEKKRYSHFKRTANRILLPRS